jgi:hypothetical protein
MQEMALRMCFALRFFLIFLLIATFARTGYAVTPGLDDFRCIATFPAILEINPAWSAVGSCIVAAALILRHSAKFRK